MCWLLAPDPAATLPQFAHHNWERRWESLNAPNWGAFASIGAASVPILIDVLESGNRIARANAARALGLMGPEAQAAIPMLTQALQDSHPWVRAEATKALAQIDDHAA